MKTETERRSRTRIRLDLIDYLSDGGTLNGVYTDSLYREWFSIREDAETDLEHVEQWAFETARRNTR